MGGDQFAAYVLRPSTSNSSPTSSLSSSTNSNPVSETSIESSNSESVASNSSSISPESREDHFHFQDTHRDPPSREREASSISVSSETDLADSENQDYRGVFAIFRARDNNSWNFQVTSDESNPSSELLDQEATTNSVTFESASTETNSGVSMSLSADDTDMYPDTSTVTIPEPSVSSGSTETNVPFDITPDEAMSNSDEPSQEPSHRVVGVGRVINVGPSRTSYLSHGSNHSSSFATLGGSQGSGTAVATATARTFRHVHTAVVVADGTNGGPQFALRTAINRAIAGAFAGCGEGAVASNIINTTHRLQWWDFSQVKLPDLKNSEYQLYIH